jgi:hypothetical protein
VHLDACARAEPGQFGLASIRFIRATEGLDN